jgi:hypothetical protein
MERENITTISIGGTGNHQEVIKFAEQKGYTVKIWNKRGPSANRNSTVTTVKQTQPAVKQ